MTLVALLLAYVSLAAAGLNAWTIATDPPGLLINWIAFFVCVGTAAYFMVQANRRHP